MPFLILYFLINLLVLLIYGMDKRKARKQQWRIPERTLLLLAVLGPFGAVFGMYAFHHKTQKPKFYIGVPLIMLLESGFAAWLLLKK